MKATNSGIGLILCAGQMENGRPMHRALAKFLKDNDVTYEFLSKETTIHTADAARAKLIRPMPPLT